MDRLLPIKFLFERIERSKSMRDKETINLVLLDECTRIRESNPTLEELKYLKNILKIIYED